MVFWGAIYITTLSHKPAFPRSGLETCATLSSPAGGARSSRFLWRYHHLRHSCTCILLRTNDSALPEQNTALQTATVSVAKFAVPSIRSYLWTLEPMVSMTCRLYWPMVKPPLIKPRTGSKTEAKKSRCSPAPVALAYVSIPVDTS